MTNITKIIERLCLAFFNKESIDHIIELIDENIFVCGFSNNLIVKGIKDFVTVWKEKQTRVEDCSLLITSSKKIDDFTGVIEFKLEYKNVVLEYQMSAFSVNTQNAKKISSLHYSVKKQQDIESETKAIRDRQKLLNETMPGGMMGGYMLPGFPFYFVNQRMLDYLGYNSEEEFVCDIEGLIDNCIHVDDRERVNIAVYEQIKEKGEYQVDYRMRKKDGSYIWVHDIGKKIIAENGTDAITSVCYDITKEKEHALLLNKLINHSKGGLALYRIEEDWKIIPLFVSKGVSLLSNRNQNEYINLCDDDAMKSIYEEDRAEVMNQIRDAVENDKVTTLTFRIPDASGGYIWINGMYSKSGESNGRPILRAVFTPSSLQYDLHLAVLNTDNIGVYVVNEETDELYYANDAIFKMHGIKRGNVLGKTCHEAFFSCIKRCDDCWLNSVINKENKKFTFKSKSGLILSVTAQKRRWNNKDILICIATDETEKERLHQEVISANTQLANIINLVPAGVCLYSWDGKRLEPVVVSEYYSRLMDMDGKQLMNNTIGLDYSFVHPDDLSGLQEFIINNLTKPGNNITYKYRIWNEKKQEYVPFLVSGNVVKGGDDKLLLYLAFTDIENEVKLQRDLQLSNDSFTSLLKNTSCGIAIYKRTKEVPFSVLYLNEEFCEMYGATREELIKESQKSYASCVLEEYKESVINAYKKICNDFIPAKVIYKTINHKGKTLWIAMSLRAIKETDDSVIIYATYFDITNEVVMSNDLKKNQEILEKTCEFAGMWTFTYDIEKNIAYTSDNLQKEYNFPPTIDNFSTEIFTSKYFLSTYKKTYSEAIEKLRNGEKEVNFDVQAKLSDGLVHWIRFRGSKLSTESNMVVCSVLIIDAEKRMEERHKKATEFIEHTKIDNLLLSGHCSITDNIIFEMNDLTGQDLLSRFGNSREDFFLGLGSLIIDEKSRNEFYNLFLADATKRMFQSGTTQYSFECGIHFDQQQKTLHWIQIKIVLLEVPTTRKLEGFLTITDITKEKKRENALCAVTTQDYDYIMIVDVNSDTYELYPRMEDRTIKDTPRTGIYSEEIKKYADKYVLPEDSFAAVNDISVEFLKQKLSEVKVYTTQARLVGEDNNIEYKQVKCSYLDDTKAQIIITRIDITNIIEEEERKKKELSKALADAELATKAKSNFLSRMSHDLRTPMNAIIGLSALTLDDSDSPEKVKDYMGKMHTASDYMLDLIKDILDVAKIEEGSMVFNNEPYSYDEFILNIRTMFSSNCEEKGIKLDIKPIDINPIVLVDKVRINQVFFNILSNSLKFTPVGGSIKYYVENMKIVNGKLQADYIIEDTGIGMDKEFIKRAFDAFTQENDEITSHLQGTGLGLSITKNLIELMGGNIRIESEKGKGTKISIFLSLECIEESSKVVANQVEYTEEGILEGKTILVVEDHPLNAQIARRLLEKKNMIVLHAENGKVALDMFKSTPVGSIDAILMDINMPIMSGLEATEKIRQLPRIDAPTIPIIAMSANAYAEDIKKSIDAGMNKHLAKPVDPKKLYETLENIIKRQHNKTT